MSGFKNYAHLFGLVIVFEAQRFLHHSLHLEPDERRSNHLPLNSRLSQVEANIPTSAVPRIFNEHAIGCRQLSELRHVKTLELVRGADFHPSPPGCPPVSTSALPMSPSAMKGPLHRISTCSSRAYFSIMICPGTQWTWNSVSAAFTATVRSTLLKSISAVQSARLDPG